MKTPLEVHHVVYIASHAHTDDSSPQHAPQGFPIASNHPREQHRLYPAHIQAGSIKDANASMTSPASSSPMSSQASCRHSKAENIAMNTERHNVPVNALPAIELATFRWSPIFRGPCSAGHTCNIMCSSAHSGRSNLMSGLVSGKSGVGVLLNQKKDPGSTVGISATSGNSGCTVLIGQRPMV